MATRLNKDFFYAAAVRAIRTVAQTALSMIGVGMAISDISWPNVASVAVVAGLVSLLTSIATDLPEVPRTEVKAKDEEE